MKKKKVSNSNKGINRFCTRKMNLQRRTREIKQLYNNKKNSLQRMNLKKEFQVMKNMQRCNNSIIKMRIQMINNNDIKED